MYGVLPLVKVRRRINHSTVVPAESAPPKKRLPRRRAAKKSLPEAAKPLAAELAKALLRDQFPLRRRLQQLSGDAAAQQKVLADVKQRIDKSIAVRSARAASLQNIEYPPELPISQARDELMTALRKHQVVVVCGDTGSGKSTQLPKMLLDLGYGTAGMIAHTQPRRIAARSIAARVADELGCEVGQEVGFKVRFADTAGEKTRVKLVTDGMLLAELQQDRFLNQYDAIIIDEAHERSLNIDFLMGYLTQLCAKRRDLKIVITSATIDPERFAKHFGGAPIIRVAGRTYPVDVRYRPLVVETEGDEDNRDIDELEGIRRAVDELWNRQTGEGPGNALIFLAGERQINETRDFLVKHFEHRKGARPEVMPLYSRLSLGQQQAALAADGKLRIVLATNVAETSLTVPGIRYVIDTGTARISRYRPSSQVQGLSIEPISQASANQRSGRCGRVGPGIAIRLYAEDDFNTRDEFTDPEIHRSNLAQVLLQMQSLRLGEIGQFPFLDMPDGKHINHARKVLEELGALDEHRKLTAIGKELARIPVDPRIGRLLIAGRDYGCAPEMAVLAALLSVQDPRERPTEARGKADEAHAVDTDKRSDYITLLNLWRRITEQKQALSSSQFRRWCRDNYLGFLRIREWFDVHRQFGQLLPEAKGKPLRDRETFDEPQPYAQLHTALLTGLITQIGELTTKGDYRGPRNQRFHIFPGSSVFGKKPKWLMTFETVETTKVYARTNADIRPAWVETAGPHLLKSQYLEPRFSEKRQQVLAKEQVSIYSLVLSQNKKVNFGMHDPKAARELFIQQAMVAGELRGNWKFWKHNQNLQLEVEQLEAKGRRRDLMVDDYAVQQFYADRIPLDVNSAATLDKWHRQAVKENPQLLVMNRDDLMQREPDGLGDDAFPNHISVNGVVFALRYGFDPGQQQDGVTVQVPLPLLNQLPEWRLDWLVPGLITEKIETLLRGLPKTLRRNFVPVPDFAASCVSALAFAETELLPTLTVQLKKMTGITIPPEQWLAVELPAHLQMRVELLNEAGQSVEAGRKLAPIQKQHGEKASQKLRDTLDAAAPHDLERDPVERWDFGDLPEQIEIERNGLQLRATPALVWEGDRLQLKLLDHARSADAEHRLGLLRLYAQHTQAKLKYLRQKLPQQERMELNFSKLPDTGASLPPPLPGNSGRGVHSVREDLLAAALYQLGEINQELHRTEAGFAGQVKKIEADIVPWATSQASIVAAASEHYREARKLLDKSADLTMLPAVQDAREQLDRLVYRGFIYHTPPEWLKRVPVYLQALCSRFDKLQGRHDLDQQRQNEVARYWRRYEQLVEKHGDTESVADRLVELRWWIEEYRISLWAQHLGTVKPISSKRLDKLISEAGRIAVEQH